MEERVRGRKGDEEDRGDSEAKDKRGRVMKRERERE